ncbi:isopeptide-forming domain-containing fimbrial protein [Finegoldia magna]|uniref:isopeptide-forming domain-containing fimbrial protein n=1 Tax=Finegoldia magna TaxID=1260 RepID=UPI0029082B47|nr:isopeptide-forming domain-containing fimbrial protein [Finegoldia magna]MDU4731104.1 isopeptide-forming domain-containing fimbrial protein [Finegoldia magna]
MKKRFLSLIIALAMMVGVFTPLLTSAEAQAGTPVGPTAKEETTAKVTIHKIKVKSTTGFPIEQKEGANEIVGKDDTTKYSGGKIDNITGFFGDGSEELTGVKFVYWTFDSKDNYEKMVKEPGSYDTVDKVKALLNADGTEIESGKTTDAITVPANGHKYVWAVEKSKTVTVKDENGKEVQQTITGGAAVPFGLALPLFKTDGTVNSDIHVYPKNTTANEPKVDKDFKGKANAEQDRREVENDIVEDAYVGQVKDYDIETIIPAGAKYKTVAWTDQMTEGLTFNNNVKIMKGAKGAETEWDAANYKVTPDGNGFVLELTEAGLKAIEEEAKNADVRLLVQYSATVNENAKVDRQERNDVVFHFGNDPHHGNTPYPTKPSNGSLTVNKEFSDAQGAWKDGEKVKVTLTDAHTGKPVVFKDGQEATVELTKGTKESHTWTGLDNDRQYKVVEQFTPGDEVTYEKQEDGTVKIIDKKTDNPNPKDPQEPGVIVYGHRFQKVDQEGKGLADAKFVVRNNIENDANKRKVLAQKEAKDIAADQAAYVAAEKAYKDAVKEGKADTEIAPLKEARDKAYVTVNTQWKWIEDKTENGVEHAGAYVFTSGTDGYFKVTGLQKGAYELVETEAPKGYAKLTSPVPFTIDADSTGVTELKGEKLEDAKGFTQVENKKVTIPQTGGIGTIIFTAIGLAIMASAIIAIKKRQATEAR